MCNRATSVIGWGVMGNFRSLEHRLEDDTVPSTTSRASNAGLRDVFEAVVALSTELDLSTVLQHIVERAKGLVGARYAALSVLDETGSHLQDFVFDGVDPRAATLINELPEGKGILGELLRSPKPLRIDDLTSHRRFSGFPTGHPLMKTFLGVPITIASRPFGNLYLTDKTDGSLFSAEDEDLITMLAGAAGVAIHNARLYEHSLRHRRWLEATTTITTHMLRGAQSADVLTEIADVAKEMAGADECGVRLVGPNDHCLKLTAAAGAHSKEVIGEEMPIRGTFLGAVFTTGKTSSSSDLGAIAPEDVLVTLRGIGPVLAVALITPERTLGTLSLSRYRGRAPFDPSDLELVESFAGQAALALAFGETREIHERLILSDDRERIARDLHDLVIQRVFAAGLTLQAAAALMESGPAHDRVTGVVDELDDTISELRTTIFALQQSDHRPSTLRVEITELVQQASRQLGFTPRLRITGEIDTRVDHEVAEHLLAVLREAMSNVMQHAHARRLHITIEVGTELRLSVEDDGVGLPDNLERRSGLKNLDERATELGGTSTWDRGPLEGARFVWVVPLVPPDSPSADNGKR